jgi:hypothetical protein
LVSFLLIGMERVEGMAVVDEEDGGAVKLIIE